jgi:tetratricopeptide (TPR) repeat protein
VNRLVASWLSLLVLTGAACGPITPYPNMPLDTPERHVYNGMTFLEIDKFDAAIREFDRALELDSEFAPAFVGKGLAYGKQGEADTGLYYMKKAEENCRTDAEKELVKDGYRQLGEMKP